MMSLSLIASAYDLWLTSSPLLSLVSSVMELPN
jgi:hypothetical protein